MKLSFILMWEMIEKKLGAKDFEMSANNERGKDE